MQIFKIITMLIEIGGGVAVLLFGRRLFWLLVGLMGFVMGLVLVRMFTDAAPSLPGILFALALGAVGIVVVRVIQRVVFTMLGFLGGGVLALLIANIAQGGGNVLDWADVLTFIAGGFVGAFVLARLADWGLILLSALLGANAIVSAIISRFSLHPTAAVLLIVLLFFLGVSVQSGGANLFEGQQPPPAFGLPTLPRIGRKQPSIAAGQK